MPVYAYKGMTAAGKSTKGFVDAENDRTARSRLRRDGVFLTDLREAANRPTPAGGSRSISFASFQRVSQLDLAIATRQLATLIGAGIPLVEALGALTEQVESTRLKSVLAGVRDHVNEGATLADALAVAGPFSTLFVSMVRAGEAGGALEQVLDRLADYLETQMRTRNKVISVMIYPAVMFVVAIGVVIVLVTLVLPQITDMLESFDKELPVYTVAIIAGSNFVRGWWWAILAVVVSAVVGGRALLRTERGRARFDAFKLRAPIIGRITRQLAVARFSRTLATLSAGGIPIVRALEISKHVANNVVIAAAIERAQEAITEGSTVAAPLRASGQFPPMVTHMIEVGERSGELEPMLAKVADTYDEQVENSITRLTALLEPLLILLMVGMVLFIVLSVLMPMLDFTNSIQ